MMASAPLVVSALLLGFAPDRSVSVGHVSEVAAPCEGSSNPTFFSNNRRLAVAASGRILAVYDPHGSGQQLAWRDGDGAWATRTQGAVDDGFLSSSAPGDRPASIALARDAMGRQHAWIVTSGAEFKEYPLPVELRRLSALSDRAGPRVGVAVLAQKTGLGNARADLAFEMGRRGRARGVVAWLQRVAYDTYRLMTAWFTNHRVDRPRLHHRRALLSTRGDGSVPTLVTTPKGMRVVVRTGAGRLVVFRHSRPSPLSRWTRSRARITDAGPQLSAVHLASRGIFAATQVSNRSWIKVIRFLPRAGRTRVVGLFKGYAQPTVAGRGSKVWVLMVRLRDGALVSRRLTVGFGWSKRDRVEIAAAPDASYLWPNAFRRAGPRLRVLVQGRRCPTNPKANQVVAYQRVLR
jgi:hypothetical protein